MARSDREQGTSRGLSKSGRQTQEGGQNQGELARRGIDPFGFGAGDFLANPFAVMRRMHDEMDRMMAQAFGGRAGAGTMGGATGWAPAVEIAEKDNELSVCAELPGLKPEDVKIEVTDDALVIEGERKHEHEDKQGGRWHSERSYGHFYRSIPLPEGANTEQARAEFKNGELRITVPMERQQSKRRQITISGASGTEEKQQKK